MCVWVVDDECLDSPQSGAAGGGGGSDESTPLSGQAAAAKVYRDIHTYSIYTSMYVLAKLSTFTIMFWPDENVIDCLHRLQGSKVLTDHLFQRPSPSAEEKWVM